MKELWASRNQNGSSLALHTRPVVLRSIADLDQWSRERAQATSDLTTHHERTGLEIAGPESWFAPGWVWLSGIEPDELMAAARNGLKSKELSSYTAYVKITTLIGNAEDVDPLLREFSRD
jgi:hypothetical protein